MSFHRISSIQHCTSVEKPGLSHPPNFVYKTLGVLFRKILNLQHLLLNFGQLIALPMAEER